jgi:FimV-like protein
MKLMLNCRMRLLVALPIALVMAAGFASGQMTDARQNAVKALDDAIANVIQAGDHERARALLLQAISIDPTFLEPRYNLATLAAAEERWEEAIRHLDEIVARGPPESLLAVRAKRTLARLHALKDRDKTPEGQRGRRYEEYVAHGRLLAEAGLTKESVASASQAIEFDRQRWEAYVVLAAALARQRNFVESERYLRMALTRAPQDKLAALQRAIRLNTSDGAAHRLGVEGAHALLAKEYGLAAQRLHEAWKTSRANAEHGLLAAEAYAAAGRHREARELLPEVVAAGNAQTRIEAAQMLETIK